MSKRLLLCAALASAGCLDDAEPEVGSAASAVVVTWTSLVGVSAAGNDLTKTGAGTAFDAGAVSVETIAGDGYVEFTTAEATTTKQIGLSTATAVSARLTSTSRPGSARTARSGSTRPGSSAAASAATRPATCSGSRSPAAWSATAGTAPCSTPAPRRPAFRSWWTHLSSPRARP